MENGTTLLNFVKTVLLLTFGQIVSIFGVFFFFGLILYLLARFTRVSFVKSIGRKFDIYITGIIGTPVHELGHAIFCIPFGHRIVEMKLFKPNTADGSLGYVNHVYKHKNIWHNIGNFFIGFGPILFGSFVLFLLIKYLVPDNQHLLSIIASQKVDISSWHGIQQQLSILFIIGKSVFSGLFSATNIQSWQFWIFLYLSLSISSHMELSPPDLKGLWSGLLTIIIFLFVVNSICVFFSLNISRYILIISSYSQMSAGIFTLAVLLSFMFFTSSFIALNIYTLIRLRRIFHPFASCKKSCASY